MTTLSKELARLVHSKEYRAALINMALAVVCLFGAEWLEDQPIQPVLNISSTFFLVAGGIFIVLYSIRFIKTVLNFGHIDEKRVGKEDDA